MLIYHNVKNRVNYPFSDFPRIKRMAKIIARSDNELVLPDVPEYLYFNH